MLTKDLLRFTIRKNTITPQLIDPQDAQLLNTAEELIAHLRDQVGNNREEVEGSQNELIDGLPGALPIKRGLQKLLMDRATFDQSADEGLIEMRGQVFRRATELRKEQDFEDVQSYLQPLAAPFQRSSADFADYLYSDLPPYQRLTEFKTITAQRLLFRYNAALVQGLLLRSERLEIHLPQVKLSHARKLLQSLRFYQLLAKVEQTAEGLNLILDGPLSLFMQNQKYGLNLAWFFSSLLFQPRFTLSALIAWNKGPAHQLELENSPQLQPYHTRFVAYIPDEVQLFQQNFQAKEPNWKIKPGGNPLKLPGESICLPDFWLTHPDGRTVALELFHAWHKAPLLLRLKQLEQFKQSQSPALILGVNRQLHKHQEIAEALDSSEYFNRYGVLYRDLPTVDKIRQILTLIS